MAALLEMELEDPLEVILVDSKGRARSASLPLSGKTVGDPMGR